MRNQRSSETVAQNSSSLTVFLPGWADDARSPVHPAPLIESVESALIHTLSGVTSELNALPGAQCRWQQPAGEPTLPKGAVCADPVHLIAGSDDAQLVPTARLAITMDETRALVDELNAVLGDARSGFLVDSAGHWYYHGLEPAALNTLPTSAVEGHPMTGVMPRTVEARPWRSLWSEVQMALHQASVNQARQARGAPVINSLWFWGGGVLPELSVDSSVVVFSDDDFVRGLTQALNIECCPIEQATQLTLDKPTEQAYVVVDTCLLAGDKDRYDTVQRASFWCEQLAQYVAAAPGLRAELNGLTGCQEVILPAVVKPRSVLSRLADLFQK